MRTIHLSEAQVACLLDILERAEARYVEDSEDRHAHAGERAKASVDAATVSRMFTLIQNQTREIDPDRPHDPGCAKWQTVEVAECGRLEREHGEMLAAIRERIALEDADADPVDTRWGNLRDLLNRIDDVEEDE